MRSFSKLGETLTSLLGEVGGMISIGCCRFVGVEEGDGFGLVTPFIVLVCALSDGTDTIITILKPKIVPLRISVIYLPMVCYNSSCTTNNTMTSDCLKSWLSTV
jgi:hypothetical protein